MTKEIAQNEQFLLLPQCFRLFLLIKPSFMEIFHVFVRPSVKTLRPLYTEHPSSDLNQTWYTVSIWQGLEVYLF